MKSDTRARVYSVRASAIGTREDSRLLDDAGFLEEFDGQSPACCDFFGIRTCRFWEYS